MAGSSWLVDGNRIATKIKSASDPSRVTWKSNPTKACPNCQYVIDNSDVVQEWPGLPRGVKFDPTDSELIWHLLTKVGVGDLKPHAFIDEFIPTVEKEDGICYTHPQNLPGVKQDGSVSHFFYRAIKAYNTGTRKRRKIQGDDIGDLRWHKTGKTKPVCIDGVQHGCKKIMVLYMGSGKGKLEKTNWVMHQYHLGTGEEENDGEYVVSKIFYQQQQSNKADKTEEDLAGIIDAVVPKVPVTPSSVTPVPPRTERQSPVVEVPKVSSMTDISSDPYIKNLGIEDDFIQYENNNDDVQLERENHIDQMEKNEDDCAVEDIKCWDSESQHLLDSQQLVEALCLCDEFLQSQEGNDNGEANGKPSLSDYAKLGPEHLKKDLEECQNLVLDPAKKDLEECQNLVLDPANIELDTPPDFRLSQLEFGSQDSFLAWGDSKLGD